MADTDDTLPFVAFGNDELDRLPRVQAGDPYDCRCGTQHLLEVTEAYRYERGRKVRCESSIMVYRCGGASYLGAVDGRRV